MWRVFFTFSIFFWITLSSFAQNGLTFDSVIYMHIEGLTTGAPDFVNNSELIVEPGYVIKITSTSVNIIEGISDLPVPIDNSNQGAIFLDEVIITTVPEASSRGVNFPIWLPAGTYQIGLKTNSARLSNEVKGFISGIKYKID